MKKILAAYPIVSGKYEVYGKSLNLDYTPLKIPESPGGTLLPSLFISILLVANTALANVTFPAKEIKVTPVEPNIEISNLRAKLIYSCEYIVGPSHTNTKECAPPFETSVLPNPHGVFKFPALTKFHGPHGDSLDNYEIELIFFDGEEQIFSISARGEKPINDLSTEALNIKVLKLNPFSVDIRIDGQQIADTHRATLDMASLSVYTKIDSKTNNWGTDSFQFFDGHLGATITNNKNHNLFPLKDIRVAHIVASYLAYKEDVMPKTSISIAYQNLWADGVAREDREIELEFPGRSDGLSQIKRVDLK